MADDDLEPLITECPSCSTRFRVAESHLQHAGGRVRCGACLTVFNGIEHLTMASARQFASEEQAQQELDDLLDELAGDKPARQEGADAPRGTGSASPAAAKPSAPAGKGPKPGKLSPLPGKSPHRGPIFAGFEVDEPQPPVSLAQRLGVRERPGKEAPAAESATQPVAQPGRDAHVDRTPESSPQPAASTPASAAVPEPADEFSFHVLNEGVAPAPLSTPKAPKEQTPAQNALSQEIPTQEPSTQEPPARKAGLKPWRALTAARDTTEAPPEVPVFGDPRPWRPWVWAGIVVGTLLLIAQVLWYQFDSWGKDPLWRSVYAPMCRMLGCELPVQRDTALLRTRNLAVRSHPDASTSLLVDAVIVNDAEFAQPFPVLELRFTTVRGMLVAGRRFEPDEYLAGDARGMRLMPPRTPVQIALTIDDPGPDAVNYFLRFR